jgi:D-glycero-D-manno-heptose 1,7-bisphosphate phosphatase
MSLEIVEKIHDNLRYVLKNEYDLELLDIFCCPHNNNECDCRKPKPGMLLQAAEQYNIDLSASWMIGDSATDIEAGSAAGCRTIYVGGKDEPGIEDFRIGDMDKLPELLKRIL